MQLSSARRQSAHACTTPPSISESSVPTQGVYVQLSSARRHQLMHAPRRQATARAACQGRYVQLSSARGATARAACTSIVCAAEQCTYASAHACTTPPSISKSSVLRIICAAEQCTKAISLCMHHAAKLREQCVQVPYVQQSNQLMHAPRRQASARAAYQGLYVQQSSVRGQAAHACTTPPSISKSSMPRITCAAEQCM